MDDVAGLLGIFGGGYTAGEWVESAGVLLLIFVVAVALVAFVVGLFRRGQESLTKTLLHEPAVPITAVVLTVCCELIMHR